MKAKYLISVLSLLIMFTAVSGIIDRVGESYTNEAMKRALIAFGVARGLNGLISVAQGTEIAVHPAGLGINFTPGQILDPINDLVEQFSWIMLASAASVGIQKIFLEIGSSVYSTALLLVLMILVLLSQWWPALLSMAQKRLILYASLILLFVRFSVPLIAIGSELIYEVFLSHQYSESTQRLESTQSTLGEMNKELSSPEKGEASLLERAKQYFDSAKSSLDYETRLTEYKELASEVSLQIVNLIVVFVMQTVLLPLIFLWVIYLGFRRLLSFSLARHVMDS